MNYIFLGAALPIAMLNWIAVAQGWRRVEWLAKPTVMLALLAFTIGNGGLQVGMMWFIFGLAFSLAGDVFLMLPHERFIAGLVSFLLAHICYIIGLNPIPPLKAPHLVAAALIILLVALPASQIYRRVAAGLQARGQDQLKLPVLAYTIVISVMLISALFTMLRGSWPAAQALLVSAGAALFFLSDAILAWNRFVAPLPRGRVWNMMSYHLGQMTIALGAALYFLS
jgi:uncharacterized membrane protein YhhN